MITTMFFILVPFPKRAPYIIIHLARNAERREEASIILPKLESLIYLSGSGSVSGFRIRGSGFRIPAFPYAPC